MDSLFIYFSNRSTQLSLLMDRRLRKWKRKHYHQLRLELKKIAALADLANFSDEKFDRSKALAPFLSLFRQAGKIRTLQLEKTWVASHDPHHKSKHYRYMICQSIREEKHRFNRFRKVKFITELWRSANAFQQTLAFIPASTVKKYLDNCAQINHRFLEQTDPAEADLHEARRRMKRYKYISSALNPMEVKVLPGPDGLMDLLGKWHDIDTFLQDLNRKKNEALHAWIPGELQHLKKAAVNEQAKLYDDIVVAMSHR